MRRLPVFQAARSRPRLHLCLPHRRIASLPASHARPASITAPLHASPSPAHTAAGGAVVGSSKPSLQEEAAEAAAAPATPASGLSTPDSASFPQSSSAAAPLGSEISVLTLEHVNAFIERHRHLCEHLFLSSSHSLLGPRHASRHTVFPRCTTITLSGGVDGDPDDGGVADSTERHSHRAMALPDSAVREMRDFLDRLAQASHVLGALSDVQRQRLITDVCRIAYAVGLHRRCCALYVDAVLLSTTVGSAAPPHTAASGPPSSLPWSLVGSAVQPTIPDFVVDAAGEAGDLHTLEHCLRCAEVALRRESNSSAPTPGAAVVDMGPGWMAALQVFVQCVRVALRCGWQAPPPPPPSLRPSSPPTDSELPSVHARLPAALPLDHMRNGSMNINGAEAADHAGGALTRQPGSPTQPVHERWHRFALQVLELLHVPRPADLYAVALRTARYHFADTNGDWAAAQAAVHACCFRAWLGEADCDSAAAVRVDVGSSLPCVTQVEIVTPPDAAASARDADCTATAVRQVRLTSLALLTLLRSAVAARQHNTAEWATLYVDAHLLSVVTPSTAFVSPDATAQLDTLLFWYLRYLQQSNQPQRARRWLHRVRRHESTSAPLRDALHSLPVLREAARVAGDTLDVDLALWCLQRCLDDRPAPAAPAQRDVFACLCALARCGLPTFEVVLQSLLSNGLLTATAEEVLFARLLHARRSVQWRAELERCLSPYVVPTEENGSVLASRRESRAAVVQLQLFARPAAALRDGDGPHSSALTGGEGGEATPGDRGESRSTVFSPRVMHHVLLLLQEGEHPSFMAYYRTFLIAFGAHVSVNDRARWAVLALAWAGTQQGTTAAEDLVYMAREVDQLMALQEAYLNDGSGPTSGSGASRASARRRPLPIAADLYVSLERKWAVLYQQVPPSWWRGVSARENGRAHTTSSSPLLPPSLLLEESALQRMAAAALRSGAGPATALARFTRRRRCLPSAEVPAAHLLLASVVDSESGQEVCWDGLVEGQAHSFASACGVDGGVASTSKSDRALWARYVASQPAML